MPGDQRQAETALHTAFREALVNTLIHADYQGCASLCIFKYPNRFMFQNPGRMRLPASLAFEDGQTECRNVALQQMVMHMGLAERAGSGMSVIKKGCRKQHWSLPELTEEIEPDRTRLMLCFFSEKALEALQARFGHRLDNLTYKEKTALALAEMEGRVNHPRLCEVADAHRTDATKAFQRLGMLESTGNTRNTVYFLPGTRPSVSAVPDKSLLEYEELPSECEERLEKDDIHRESRSRYSLALDLSIVDDLEKLPPEERARLMSQASIPRRSKRVDSHMMETIIEEICSSRYMIAQRSGRFAQANARVIAE